MDEGSDGSGTGAGGLSRGSGPAPARKAGFWIAVAAVAVLGMACGGVLYANHARNDKAEPGAEGLPRPTGPLARYAEGPLKRLQTTADRPLAPTVAFKNAQGQASDLSGFRGHVVVVNAWATWCAPCKVEMPTLAALAATYAGRGLVVAPISVDRPEDLDMVKAFVGGLTPPLPVFTDPSFAVPGALQIENLPGTLILDRHGRIAARMEGEADWNSPQAHQLIEHLLAEG